MISELLRLSTLSTSSLNFGLACVKVHGWQCKGGGSATTASEGIGGY